MSIPVECPVCTEPMQNPTRCEWPVDSATPPEEGGKRRVGKRGCRQYWCGRCDQKLTECPYCREPIPGRQSRAQQAAAERRHSWERQMLMQMHPQMMPPQPIEEERSAIITRVNGRDYVTIRGRQYPVEDGYVDVSDDEGYIIASRNGRRVLIRVIVDNEDAY